MNEGKATRPSGNHGILDSQRGERYKAAHPPIGAWEPPPPPRLGIFTWIVLVLFAAAGIGLLLFGPFAAGK
jgi:hypothetical protein